MAIQETHDRQPRRRTKPSVGKVVRNVGMMSAVAWGLGLGGEGKSGASAVEIASSLSGTESRNTLHLSRSPFREHSIFDNEQEVHVPAVHVRPVVRTEARGAVRAGIVSRPERQTETTPGNLRAYESLAGGFFGLGSLTRRKLLILGTLALLFSTCVPQSITPTAIATETAPVSIEQMVNGDFTFVGPNGAFPGSLTTADCTPLTGSLYETYQVYYNLTKGAEVRESAWQLCSATLNLRGGGVLPDVSSKVAVFVDRTANASYVLMGESEPGSKNPYGRLAVLQGGELDLTNAPRFEVLDQEDGSKKIYVTGTFADGTEGPYNLDVNIDVFEGTTTDQKNLPPYIMGAVLPLLQPLTSDYMTPTATAISTRRTPKPTQTPEPTATPVPTYSVEQLTAMSAERKLAIAPQVATAPADVVASFLPQGADAAGITWGQKSLTYWERVVAYHGKAGEQEVTLYYDLESGQWAKKYAVNQLSQIPADRVPDVMVLGGRLIHVNPQYEDGKKLFRDEQGSVRVIFDTVNKKWLMPTEAPEAIDLKPNYEQNVSMEYMVVNMDASLITDESLDPVIKKVTVGESAYAEFVARSIYKVWLTKGGLEGKGPATDTTFEQFMALWATAQQSGKEEDWRQVQVKNIWANEISTPGYEQEPYTIWFMYNGQAPEDVKGISKVSIALVKTSKMKNITDFNNVYNTGMGTNINDEIMYFYAGLPSAPYSSGRTANFIASFNWFLLKNSGSSLSNDSAKIEEELKAILINGGITQKP